MKKKLLAPLLLPVMLLSLFACSRSADHPAQSTAPATENQMEATEQTDAVPTETTQVIGPPADDTLYALKVGAGTAAIELDPSIFPTEGFNGEIHDDPHVRILLLEAGEKAAIVSCELVNTPEAVIEGIIAKIAEKAGVPEANIWVHSTHAITTPHKPGNESVLKAAEEALEQALASFAPATVGVGTITCDVNANRNIETPEGVLGGPYYGMGSTGYSNKTMTLIRFDGENGSPIAFFMSYGIKPTVIDNSQMDAGTRVISADVTGKACTMIEEAFGATCLFCMPAAGDQYPKEMTVYYALNEDGTKMEEIDLGVAAGIEIMERLGSEMGDQAMELAGSISCDTEESLVKFASGTFAATEGNKEVEVEVSTMRLGDIAFVGFKQELDAQTEKEIQEASPFTHTLLVSFLNGDGKYMPHDAAYDYNNGKGTYEVSKSRFERGSAEFLVALATELLWDMR